MENVNDLKIKILSVIDKLKKEEEELDAYENSHNNYSQKPLDEHKKMNKKQQNLMKKLAAIDLLLS